MKIAFAGDVMLGRLVNDRLRHQPPEYPWGDTLPLWRQADLRLCNLECVVADGGAPYAPGVKAFHFRSDGKNVAVLNAAAIDMVSLANNHVLDYGEEALLRMLSALHANGIAAAGAGVDGQGAAAPAIVTAAGWRVGLLALTDNEPGWRAAARPGVNYMPIDVEDTAAQRLFAQIKALRTTLDYLIVAAHWGPNWGYEPPAEQVPFAHALVDAGADLVFGHSGHVVRGIELYRGRPIVYCAGDFIDDYAVDMSQPNDESFLFLLELAGQQGVLRLYPTVIADCRARRATPPQAACQLTRMQRLCAGLGTTLTVLEDSAFVTFSPSRPR